MPTLRLQIRRDTSQAWTEKNPKLFPGEMALETDTGFLKIGLVDPFSEWNDIPYFPSETRQLQEKTTLKDLLDEFNQDQFVKANGEMAYIRIEDVENLDLELASKADLEHTHTESGYKRWKLLNEESVLQVGDSVVVLKDITLYLPKQVQDGDWVRINGLNSTSVTLISTFNIVKDLSTSKKLTLVFNHMDKDYTLVCVQGSWMIW